VLKTAQIATRTKLSGKEALIAHLKMVIGARRGPTHRAAEGTRRNFPVDSTTPPHVRFGSNTERQKSRAEETKAPAAATQSRSVA
jgi:hypothetical protein